VTGARQAGAGRRCNTTRAELVLGGAYPSSLTRGLVFHSTPVCAAHSSITPLMTVLIRALLLFLGW